MVNTPQIIIILATAFLFIISLHIAQSGGGCHFFVEGEVYCDTCRAQFMTRLSEPMPGAKVRLVCKEQEGGHETYNIEDETDDLGIYRLQVDGYHENEYCEILLVKSRYPECGEVSNQSWFKESSRITLKSHNDDDIAASTTTTTIRHPNPLGFLMNEPFPECVLVFKELNYFPSDFSRRYDI